MTEKVEISDLEESLTVSDIAGICKVNRVTVTRWIHTGRLLAIRPPTGKPLRVRKEDFAVFMDGYKYTNRRKEGEDGDQKEGAGKVQSQR
jgi:excisionase family DNA binding protein